MTWTLADELLILAYCLWVVWNNWRCYRSGTFRIWRGWQIRRDEGLRRFHVAAAILVGGPAVMVLMMAFVLFAVWLAANPWAFRVEEVAP